MAKRIMINKHAVQGFLIQYKEKHNLNNMAMERLTGICNATLSNLSHAKHDAISERTYNKLNTFIPEDVLQLPKKGQVTLKEIQEAEKVGFTKTYIATSEGTEKKKATWNDIEDAVYDARDTVFYNRTKKINHPDNTDQIQQKDVDSIAWGVTMLEEYARKAQNHHITIVEDIGLLSEELKKIHYTLNNRTLWQRIKNKFRKNHSTEKTSINVDENSRKK